jgi:CBS domain containing-hemolysin-like protein
MSDWIYGLSILGNLGEIFPENSSLTVLVIIAILVLLGLSAFFSSAEIAMFSLSKHRIDAMVTEDVSNAKVVSRLRERPQNLLVTLLVGNNIVNIAMASVTTSVLALYYTGGVAIALSTLIITILVLVFGEIIPKSYAIRNPESWSVKIARMVDFFESMFSPVVLVFIRLAQIIKREDSEVAISSPYVTRDEIQDLLEVGKVEGVIEEEELEMLQGIFDLDTTIAKEIMTPRLDIDAVSISSSVSDAINICVGSGHMCLPVYEGNLDNILGVVTVGNLLRESKSKGSETALKTILEPTIYVPESKKIDELLAEMQKDRLGLVIVVDEFGTAEGLITLEDILEEIVGEILESEEEVPIEYISSNIIAIRGDVNIDEINSTLKIELPEGNEFETIAGFVLDQTGRMVEEGEFITYNDIKIAIEEVENTRILKVIITLP